MGYVVENIYNENTSCNAAINFGKILLRGLRNFSNRKTIAVLFSRIRGAESVVHIPIPRIAIATVKKMLPFLAVTPHFFKQCQKQHKVPPTKKGCVMPA